MWQPHRVAISARCGAGLAGDIRPATPPAPPPGKTSSRRTPSRTTSTNTGVSRCSATVRPPPGTLSIAQLVNAAPARMDFAHPRPARAEPVTALAKVRPRSASQARRLRSQERRAALAPLVSPAPVTTALQGRHAGRASEANVALRDDRDRDKGDRDDGRRDDERPEATASERPVCGAPAAPRSRRGRARGARSACLRRTHR